MKVKFKILLALLALLPFGLQAAEYSKTVHQGYAKAIITALNVSNKFGTIEINDFGGDSVTVDVIITVETSNEGRAEQLMDLIDINIYRSGGTLNAKTEINQDFKSKQNFSIDYKINIPKDRALTVTNKFGNVAVQALEAPGAFEIAYGNLTAGTLNAPAEGVQLELKYGKADIEAVNAMVGEIKYSKIFFGQAGNMHIESAYSGINIDELESLKLESKYDGVKLGRVGQIIADSKYTNYKLDELNGSLAIETAYGSVSIDKVSPGFTSIDISNTYGGVSLGMEDLSYTIDAECDYCDIKYPDDQFEGNRNKENTSLKVQGNIGASDGSQKVVIRSRYGGIKLNN